MTTEEDHLPWGGQEGRKRNVNQDTAIKQHSQLKEVICLNKVRVKGMCGYKWNMEKVG